MKTPRELQMELKKRWRPYWTVAFFSAFLIGLLVHLPIMVSDLPNHDGLASMYFDQNMITSGRWFLTIACGISSYFTLPWLIGILALFYIGVTTILLVEFLEIKDTLTIILIGGLLVSFPSIASTFAYVFTLDGYMMGLMLAVCAVFCVKKLKKGFILGGICLGFSMGIYQAYLPFAMILSIYGIVMIAMNENVFVAKMKEMLNYLFMGVIGISFYYLMLQILLKAQGKVLASYQGIEGMGSVARDGFFATLKNMYLDFFAFSLKGNVLFNNIYSAIAFLLLIIVIAFFFLLFMVEKKWWKSPFFFVIIMLLLLGLPLGTNIILLVSPEVTYHLLMRYQWVLYPILMIAFIKKNGSGLKHNAFGEWVILISGAILIFNFAITDQIGYSNLEKKYEKTYAYCIRLLERIEQTPGYYQGIPIGMIGVVGDEAYPTTDLTGKVTDVMIGMKGDYLLYTGQNYKQFIEYYLGATLNILESTHMGDVYNMDFYREMESFPGSSSIQIVDGIMYIKTENLERGEREE